mmetsp:Transcript_19443/g.29967  ORF Transcript_19443/g.29967 Transcript_19443/m.29967 type:complete len:207 (-) Transcript_19443:128-748(-)|eukprot:CAMPEP_0196810900 /NCGR_PEP_ID=MMETSP1362-20130617/15155_1 /TAXON_ID=163516 /ORGANISM="Leptocylindrus danicus, Strain CCMP1856" /LENGTH=206 /DNA_ID=CAMNT_0042186085 /DNA_START=71 /DNA_END=691 /DNA_ORIENTATION=-
MSNDSHLSSDRIEIDEVQAIASTYAKQPADNAVDRKMDKRMAQLSKLLNDAGQSVWRYKSWTYTCGHQRRHQATIAWPPQGFDRESIRVTKTGKSATIHYRILKELSDVRRILAIEAGYKSLADALQDPDFNNMPLVISAAKSIKSEECEIAFELPLAFPCEESTSCPCGEGDFKVVDINLTYKNRNVPKCVIEMNFSEPCSFNAD